VPSREELGREDEESKIMERFTKKASTGQKKGSTALTGTAF
jgi:hypothetical protein